MNEALAQECVRRMICSTLRQSGYDAASPDALVQLEDKVFKLLGGLLHLANSYAELARKTRLSPVEVITACANQGIHINDLAQVVDSNNAARLALTENSISVQLAFAEPDISTRPLTEDPTHRFLPDDESRASRRAAYVPDHLPDLPPAHSYKRTLVYSSVSTAAQAKAARIPLKDITIGSGNKDTVDLTIDSADARIALLDSRIKTTRLVEASLQNLIRATSKASQNGNDIPDVDMKEDNAAEIARKANEVVATLLKRYEKDAAICNFETDWYGPGGAAVNVGGHSGNNAAQTASQIAQRKKGRWKC